MLVEIDSRFHLYSIIEKRTCISDLVIMHILITLTLFIGISISSIIYNVYAEGHDLFDQVRRWSWKF